MNHVNGELNSIAVDWKSLRNVNVCACSTPFDQFSRKVIFILKLFNSNLIKYLFFAL